MPKRKRISLLCQEKSNKRWLNERKATSCGETDPDDTENKENCNNTNNNATNTNEDIDNDNAHSAVPLRIQKMTATTECQEFTSKNADEIEYVIIEKSSLSSLLRNLRCAQCSSSALQTRIIQRYGFVHQIDVICTFCEESGSESTCNSTLTSPKVETPTESKVFDINLRMAAAFLHLGRGYPAIEQFGMFTNIAPFSKSCFYDLEKIINTSSKQSLEKILEKARTEVRKVYDVKENKYCDIGVSFDGTWLTRGFKSQYGVACVIEIKTGYIVDVIIMSKYCHPCELASKKFGEDTSEFKIWYERHKPECQKNHDGSSGSMEMKAAEKLWQRSEQHLFRYTTMLSDGDSKAFNHINRLQPYGPEMPITKEECDNHLGKRCGTALRKLVADERTRGVTLGGKSYGSLKSATIDKMTAYYRNAIRKHSGDVEKMQQAIYATLYHCVSTDEKPQHEYCPPGVESWCFYQSSIAAGQTPDAHKKKIGTPIKPAFLPKLLPVYKKLTDETLLSRCSLGLTQNANESYHSILWRRCPKDTNPSKKRIEIAVMESVGEFNEGITASIAELLSSSGTSMNSESRRIGQKRIQNRVQRYRVRRTPAYKTARYKKKHSKAKKNEKQSQKEGSTYEAGNF